MSKNEVTAWIKIATAKPVSRIGSLSSSLLTSMSSKNGLVAQGGTRPAARLIMMSSSPIKSSFLRGQMMVLKTWPMVNLVLGIGWVKSRMNLTSKT